MDVFDLQAKISLDSKEYKQGIQEASSSFSEFGEKIKGGAAKLAKVSAAAFGAAAAGVGKVVKDSIAAYADYEQLEGGIETLFGDNAEKVIANSEKAFKTAGMSVNEYMETSIQSAAALINSLDGDTAKAADLMDMSIQDMSDNVNKMGTSMEAVQNAYRGFSRGNFTMLDNLALGFAGTKEGMQELLDKAQELSGVQYDISSYSDIVEAIHVVQTEMGITGTTAKEASETISGSIASLKASWKNLTVEMAKDDGDVEKAFSALGDNVGTVVDNIVPRVEKALGGVGKLIEAAAPQITNAISKLLPKILPSLMKSAASLTGAIGKSLIKAAPELLTATSSMMKELFTSFSNADLGIFDWVKEDAVRIVDSVKDAFKGLDLDKIKSSLSNLGNSLNNAFERVGNGLAWASENIISPLIEWAGNEALPKVFDALASSVDLLSTAFDFLKEPAKKAWDALKPFAEGTLDVIAGTIDLVSKAVGGLAKEFEGVDWSGYWDDINNGEFFADWKSGFEDILDWVDKHEEDIKDFFDVSDIGKGWREFWEDVGGSAYETQERWTTAFELLKYGVESFVDAWKVGKDTIVSAIETVKKTFEDFVEAWKTGWKTLTGLGDKAHDATENTLGGALLDTIISKLPAFGTGGKVTQPTLAVVGEKEPEYIIPESKVDDVYPRNGGSIHVDKIEFIVNGSFDIGSPEDRRKLIEELSSDLQNLSIAEQRALGGRAWQ